MSYKECSKLFHKVFEPRYDTDFFENLLDVYLAVFEKLRNYKEGMDFLSMDNLDGFNH